MQMRHKKFSPLRDFPQKVAHEIHDGELRLLRNRRDIKLNEQFSKVFAWNTKVLLGFFC